MDGAEAYLCTSEGASLGCSASPNLADAHGVFSVSCTVAAALPPPPPPPPPPPLLPHAASSDAQAASRAPRDRGVIVTAPNHTVPTAADGPGGSVAR